MTTVKPTQDRFYDNVVELIDLVYEIVSDAKAAGYDLANPNIIRLVGGFLNNYDRTKLITNFIKYSYPHWEQIRNRDAEFFQKNAMDIFRDLPMKQVNAFNQMTTLKDKNGDPVVKIEDQNAVWEFFESLVKIAIKYIHEGRRPAIKEIDGVKKAIYTARFFKEIDLEKEVRIWGIKLEFSR